MKRSDDPNQTLIDWGNPQALAVAAKPVFPDPIKLIAAAPAPLVQHLPWDFKTVFPQPSDEALDVGVIDACVCQPENLKSLHEDYARQSLATLQAIDATRDARRQGVDPATGKTPGSHAAKEQLRVNLKAEAEKLEHGYRVLIETYEMAFGPAAAQAFSKAIRAWHAGIEVLTDAPVKPHEPPTRTPAKPRVRRIVSTLPVPTPLPHAIAAGHFGKDDNGKTVHPDAAEVRAITARHAEKLIDLLDGLKQVERSLASSQCSDRARLEIESQRLKQHVQAAVEHYAGSFGEEPAARLEAYARRQVLLGPKADRQR